jgi:hypothetical protein
MRVVYGQQGFSLNISTWAGVRMQYIYSYQPENLMIKAPRLAYGLAHQYIDSAMPQCLELRARAFVVQFLVLISATRAPCNQELHLTKSESPGLLQTQLQKASVASPCLS